MAREYTITKGTVECYEIRCATGGEWADITVDAIFRIGNEINLEIIKRFLKDNDYTR